MSILDQFLKETGQKKETAEDEVKKEAQENSILGQFQKQTGYTGEGYKKGKVNWIKEGDLTKDTRSNPVNATGEAGEVKETNDKPWATYNPVMATDLIENALTGLTLPTLQGGGSGRTAAELTPKGMAAQQKPETKQAQETEQERLLRELRTLQTEQNEANMGLDPTTMEAADNAVRAKMAEIEAYGRTADPVQTAQQEEQAKLAAEKNELQGIINGGLTGDEKTDERFWAATARMEEIRAQEQSGKETEQAASLKPEDQAKYDELKKSYAAAHSVVAAGLTGDDKTDERYYKALEEMDAAREGMAEIDRTYKRSREAYDTMDRWALTQEGSVQGYTASMVNAGAMLADMAIRTSAERTYDRAVELLETGTRSGAAGTLDKIYAAADKLKEGSDRKLTTAKERAGRATQIAVDLADQAIRMGMDAAISLTGIPAKAVLGMRVYGQGAQEARQAGASFAQQNLYGAATAATEVLTECMFDGLAGIYGAGAADEMVNYFVGKLAKTDIGRAAWKLAINGVGEGLEELVSDIVNPITLSIYNNRSILENYGELSAGEMAYDFFIGAVLGFMGGTAEAVTGHVSMEEKFFRTAAEKGYSFKETCEAWTKAEEYFAAQNRQAAEEWVKQQSAEQNADEVVNAFEQAAGTVLDPNMSAQEQVDYWQKAMLGAQMVKAKYADNEAVQQAADKLIAHAKQQMNAVRNAAAAAGQQARQATAAPAVYDSAFAAAQEQAAREQAAPAETEEPAEDNGPGKALVVGSAGNVNGYEYEITPGVGGQNIKVTAPDGTVVADRGTAEGEEEHKAVEQEIQNHANKGKDVTKNEAAGDEVPGRTGGRDAGKHDAGNAGQGRAAAAGTGTQNQQRTALERIRKADSKGYKKVKSSELAPKGHSDIPVRIIPVEEYDEELEQLRQESKEQFGIEPVFYIGSLVVGQKKGGGNYLARGMHRNGEIYVQADHRKFTARQIFWHEAGHQIEEENPEKVDQFRTAAETQLGAEEAKKLYDRYDGVYGEVTNHDEHRIWTEIFCDALGEMNCFEGGNEIAKAAVAGELALPAVEEEAPAQEEAAEPEQEKEPETEPEPEQQPQESGTEFDKKASYGAEATTYTDSGPLKVRYAVVPASALIASNDVYGNINSAYPAELQPRDRTRVSSQMQIDAISKALQPEMLAESPTAQNGSPIVRNDGVVLGGNGRTLAIMKAYQNGNAGGYFHFIMQNEDKYGIPDGIPDNAVLVRVVQGEHDWAALAKELNESSTATYSATEKAKTDAEKLTAILDRLDANDEGEINTPENKDFIQAFVNRVIPASERGNALKGDGTLSAAGLERVTYAVFYAAYGDTALLEKLSESIDADNKNIQNALVAVAPRVVKYNQAVKEGNAYDVDLKGVVLEAVETYTDARKNGQTVMELTDQISLGDERSAEGVWLAKFIEKYKRGAKQLRNLLNDIYDAALESGSPNQMNMLFGAEDVNLSQTMKEGARRYERDNEKAAGKPDYARERGYEEIRGGAAAEDWGETDRPAEGVSEGTGEVPEQSVSGQQSLFGEPESVSLPEVEEAAPATAEAPVQEAETEPAAEAEPETLALPAAEEQPKTKTKKGTKKNVRQAREVSPDRADGNGTARLLEEPEAGAVQGTGAERGAVADAGAERRGDGGRHLQDDAERNVGGDGEGSSAAGDLRQLGELSEPVREAVEQKSAAKPRGYNYVIGESLELPNGQKARYRANVEAIKLVKQLEQENRFATQEEQDILAKYVGWGGIPDAFDGNKADWTKEFAELRELLTKEEYEAARASTKNAHYTSVEVIRAMYAGLEKLGFNGGRMLEPSSGVGNFVGAMPVEMSGKVNSWTMVELDKITGLIAKHLYPNADVRIQGFEEALIPDNYMDVAIGNVPFGDYPIVDKKYPKTVTQAIHNYFFAKTLDKVRPGGIVMFITSRYTMDSREDGTRNYIMSRADLLGAIRLPSDAFKGNAGTSVVTDIIVLQKRAEKTMYTGADFGLAVYQQFQNRYASAIVNNYFVKNQDMVIGKADVPENRGMYGRNEYTVTFDETKGSIGEQIAKAFENIQGKMTYPEKPTPEVAAERAAAERKSSRPKGGMVRENGKIYVTDEYGDLQQLELNEKEAKRIGSMLDIRETLAKLMEAEQQGKDGKALRKELNRLYDAFVKEFGYLNAQANKRALMNDPYAFALRSLENYDEKKKTATKADVFKAPTIAANVTETAADNVTDALVISRNRKGNVDIPFIAKLTGRSEADVTEELLESKQIFRDINGELVAAEQYLSGNVRAKLRDAKALAVGNKEYLRNVEALEKVLPETVKAEDVYVVPGAPWVPEQVYSDFAAHMLGTSNKYRNMVTVRRVEATGVFVIETGNKYIKNSSENTQKWGTSSKTFLELLTATMNSKSVTVSYTDVTTGKRVVDKDATAAANEKIEEIQKEFQEWLWSDETRKAEMETLYNEIFNSLVTPAYDGSALTVNGLAAGWQLRPHQKNAVQRIISSGGNTLLAHKVGAGKTLEMAAAAMKLKELGVIQKPMFVVPKSLVAQWGDEFKTMFPAANLMVVGENDFSPGNRKIFANRIANNSFDAVIISYESFEKIPMDTEFTKAMYREQVEEILAAIDEERRNGVNEKGLTVKELEKKRARLEAKIKRLETAKSKDTDSITFNMMGVDGLFVDEAHNFKNLMYTTAMNNVAGLGNRDGSARAFDMYTKTRYLQQVNGGRGIVFATATPVMNSMAEMYIMQRYLQEDLLKRMGLNTFDAWAKQFGQVVNAPEVDPSGTGFRVKQVFSRFKNLGELQMMFRDFADVLTKVPGLEIPKMKNGQVTTVICEPGEFQKDYMVALQKRSQNIKNVDPKEDNMLKITSDGKKISYSQRMIDPTLPYELNGKLHKAAENIARVYDESKDIKGTQVVFMDMGTPQAKGSKSSGDRVDMYADIKQMLIDNGVKSKDIAFIHDADTDAKKQKLFDDVNDGKVRVLIGSTGKMGVGMNAQKRIVAIHHLDAPWRPGDVEQRNGRAFRQKNMNKEVEDFVYVTEGSFDSRLWDILNRKQEFITQVMDGESIGREVEDTGEVTLSAAEIRALASGDSRMQEAFVLENELKKLDGLKRSHAAETQRAKDKIRRLEIQKTEAEMKMEKAKPDIRAAKLYDPKKFSMTVKGRSYTDKAKAGKELVKAAKEDASLGSWTSIATFAGFDLKVTETLEGPKAQLVGEQVYGLNVYPDNPTYGITAAERLVNGIANMVAETEATIAFIEGEIEKQKQLAERPFNKADELRKKRARYNELMDELNPKQEQAISGDGDEEYSLEDDYEYYPDAWAEYLEGELKARPKYDDKEYSERHRADLERFGYNDELRDIERDNSEKINNWLDEINYLYESGKKDRAARMMGKLAAARGYTVAALKVPGEKNKYRKITNRDAQKIAQVKDSGLYYIMPRTDNGAVEIDGNIYTVNDSRLAKSGDLEFLPKNGGLIRWFDPRERFDPGVSDERYSLEDEEYLELAQDPDGNYDRLTEMVEEAAKAAGYDIKTFHGTPDYGFREFRDGVGNGIIWSTGNERYALNYTAKKAALKFQRKYDWNKIYNLAIKMNNPLDLGEIDESIFKYGEYGTLTPEMKRICDAVGLDEEFITDMFDESEQYAAIWMFTKTAEFKDALTDAGYDGVTATERGAPTYGVVKSNQMKSLEPVTYSRTGRTIPLSERFNEDERDINYSLDFDSAEELDDYVQQAKDRADAERAERIRTIPSDEFKGTENLNKLGVKIYGGVAKYGDIQQMLERDKAAKSIVKEIKKAENRLHATAAEKNFAAGVAAGIYEADQTPNGLRQNVVEELADYYWAQEGLGVDLIKKQRREINRTLQEKMDALFERIPTVKTPKVLSLNFNTPARNMRHIFGRKNGQLVYDDIFYPVEKNEAERIRFIGRMFDEVRSFKGVDGKEAELNKTERAATMMMVEALPSMKQFRAWQKGNQAEQYFAQRVEEIAKAMKNDNGKLSVEDTERLIPTKAEIKMAKDLRMWRKAVTLCYTDKGDATRCENAAEKYAEQFDMFYDALNDFLVAHGYEPIGFIKGYAPHLQEEEKQTALNRMFKSMGLGTDVNKLPTEIAGLTASYKPNKRWNPFFLQRTGNKAKLDIASAYESYVEYMSDVLYHTDDIMRVRNMSKWFRQEYASEALKAEMQQAWEFQRKGPEEQRAFLREVGEIDAATAMSDEMIRDSMDEYVDKIMKKVDDDTLHGDLVMWLDNYANNLAGKQSAADRGPEQTLGRPILKFGNALTRQFGMSQVGGKVSSALNQAAQLPQIYAELGLKYTLRAAKDAVFGRMRRGAWAADSDFLTGKNGIDYIVYEVKDMIVEKLFTPADIMDGLMATIAVRGMYLKQIAEGKEHKQAMAEADKFGSEVMGSRAKGTKPLIFESKNPVYRMLTMFQVEVLNSWEHIARDLPRDFKQIEETEGRSAAARALAAVIVKAIIAAFALNRLDEELYGGTPAPLDIIGLTANFIASGQELTTNDYLKASVDKAMVKLTGDKLFGTSDAKIARLGDGKFDLQNAAEETVYNITNDVPLVRNAAGLLGLGDNSLPMAGVNGGLKEAADALSDMMGGDANAIALIRALIGLGLEFVPGGSQIERTAKGVETAIRGGAYTSSGKLKYPVSQDPLTVARLALFGQYSVPEAQAYYAQSEDNRKGLSDTQMRMYEMLGNNSSISSTEIYDAVTQLQTSKAGNTQEDVKAALDAMNVSNNVKAVLWQCSNKTWKPGKNPYNTIIGSAVYDALQSGETEGLFLPGLE